MADRFPSIEDIDEGTAPAAAGGNDLDLMEGGAEGSDDFLSRERAALGADADQFSTPQDNNDLLGGGSSGAHTNGASDEMSKFQSSFPAVDTRNERVAPGGSITGATSPAPPSFANEEEPEVIKQWRERRDLAIQSREEAAAARKQETIKAAQEAIDDFYENYNNKKEKGLTQSKKDAEEFLAKREDTAAGGTSWERIAKLVDVKGGKGGGDAAGKEKFRQLLAGLSKDQKAPGAGGY